MPTDLNPQATQMADESMVRNLSAQAEAIWPQEAPLLRRYALPAAPRVLDAGCGTGEISARLAELFPAAEVLGVDVEESHLARARQRCAAVGARVRFERRSIFDLGLPAGAFDLTVCRHVLQAVPRAERAVAELARVTRPGGRVHLIAEDYGLVQFSGGRLDPDAFWRTMPLRLGLGQGVDPFVGRRAPAWLLAAGLQDVAVDHVVVDTLRVPRETFAAIWTAWRDGYSAVLAEHADLTPAEVRARFDDQLETLRDPVGYAAWLVPVVSGTVPPR